MNKDRIARLKERKNAQRALISLIPTKALKTGIIMPVFASLAFVIASFMPIMGLTTAVAILAISAPRIIDNIRELTRRKKVNNDHINRP